MRRIVFRALPALVSAGVLFVAGSPMADAAVQGHAAATTTISVKATEYKFTLSKKSLSKPGKVIFNVVNKGTIPHDFKIDGKQTALLSPGQSAKLTVTLKKGSFPYMCTVSGHAALGMKGTFKVL